MRKKAGALILLVGVSISSVLGGSIELAGEGFIPEPNQEITVQIQTDTPLFAMGIGIYVIGDANITAAMSEADCNEFGWDNGWNSDPYIDPNGWVEIVGVRWDADANGTVGYFKFRYNSGQVTVSIDEDSVAYDANCEPVPFSDKTLVFGLPDPNDCNEQGEPSSQDIVPDENTPTSTEDPNDCNEQGEPPSQDIIPDENTPASTEDPNDCNEQGEPSSQDIIPDENTPASAEGPNDINIPFNNYRQDKEAERQKRLRYFPADFNSSREELSRAEWEGQLEKDGGGQMLMGGEPNVIDVNSDITSNQIWTENNIYRVTADVNVTALLVIEPGTVISFNNHGSLFINNGGALISCGTPDEPIYYTSAYIDPYPGNYYYAIYVEETASPATKIAYSYIEYAYLGVVTDNIRLDTPIENNIFFNNEYSICEAGTHLTDIINNLLCLSGCGIYISMNSLSGEADADSHILIENNTCDNSDGVGIGVHGVVDGNAAGLVTISNNIISSACTGLSLVGGWMYPVVRNTGYYNNEHNKSSDFSETDPVEVNECPYVLSDCHLKQDCPFIDAGRQYVEETAMIGMTTDYYNSLPDSNKVDIGFHHPNWGYSNAGSGSTLNADYDGNGIVNFRDFAILANGWKDIYDINNLFIMVNEWLCMSGNPAISVSVTGDANNLSGYLSLYCNNITDPRIRRTFIFIDGGKHNEIADLENPMAGLQTNRYMNGMHSIKVICEDFNGNIICSEPIDVNFNNEFVIVADSGFEPNKNYYFYGFGSGNYLLQVKNLITDEVIISENYTDNINCQISASYFTEPWNIYELEIYPEESEKMDFDGVNLDSSEIPVNEIVDWLISLKFKKEYFDPQEPNTYGPGMVISIGSEDLESEKRDCWMACLKESVRAGMYPVLLKYNDCTWDNLSFCLMHPVVKLWYHLSHANWNLWNQPPRQCIETKEGWVFSYLRRNINPNMIPNYRSLWFGYENRPSIADLGLWENPKFIWVQFNGCYSAHTSEFPFFLGLLGDEWPGHPLGNRIFIGWKDYALVHNILLKYNEFEIYYWQYLREGKTLKSAVEDAGDKVHDNHVIRDNFTTYGVFDTQLVHFRYSGID